MCDHDTKHLRIIERATDDHDERRHSREGEIYGVCRKCDDDRTLHARRSR